MEWIDAKVGATLKKRTEDLELRQRRNPFLSILFQRQFALELSLGRSKKRHQLTRRYPQGDPFDLSYGFAVSMTRMFRELTAPAQSRFLGALQGGLKSDHGLIPLAHEISTAMHFCARDFEITPVDLEQNTSHNFDFLATDGEIQIEIECKTVSPDAGHKVPLDALTNLSGHLLPLFRKLEAPSTGHLIRVQVPDRLSKSDETGKAISRSVQAAILRQDSGSDLCSVAYECIPLSGSPATLTEATIQNYFEKFMGIVSGPALFHGNGSHFIALSVGSTSAGDPVAAVSDAIKKAADQCSGTRPAVIAVQLVAMTPKQLKTMIENDSNAYVVAGSVYQNPKRSHVHSIVFTTPPTLIRTAENMLDGRVIGGAGTIRNNACRYDCPKIDGLYRTRPQDADFARLIR